MKLIDITTKAEFSEALESILDMATGPMSDREIVDAFRETANNVTTDNHVEHCVLVAYDTSDIKTTTDVRTMLLAAGLHAKTFMKASSVYGLLCEMADQYEEEAL